MLHIINYTVRVCIIIIGTLFVTNIIPAPKGNEDLYAIMGIVFILFGAYRIVMYRMKLKVYAGVSSEDTIDDDIE